MNKALLKSKISLFNHNFSDLAVVVGCSRTRLSAKLNESGGAEFTQREIEKIKRNYNLTAEEIDAIFFDLKVS